MSITLPQAFNNPALPIVGGAIGPQIKALTGLVGWFQSQAENITMVGDEIDVFNDLGGSAAKFTRNATTKRATLLADQVGKFAAAEFHGATAPDDGAADVYVLGGAALDTDAAYSFVVMHKPSDNSNGDTLLGRFTDSATRALLNAPDSGGVMKLFHGTSEISASMNLGEWNLVIGSFDGTNLNLYANGVTSSPVIASGTTGTAKFVMGALNTAGGQAFDGLISDAMLFSKDIFAAPDELALVKAYFKNLYGVQ